MMYEIRAPGIDIYGTRCTASMQCAEYPRLHLTPERGPPLFVEMTDSDVGLLIELLTRCRDDARGSNQRASGGDSDG